MSVGEASCKSEDQFWVILELQEINLIIFSWSEWVSSSTYNFHLSSSYFNNIKQKPLDTTFEQTSDLFTKVWANRNNIGNVEMFV